MLLQVYSSMHCMVCVLFGATRLQCKAALADRMMGFGVGFLRSWLGRTEVAKADGASRSALTDVKLQAPVEQADVLSCL